MTKDRAAVVSLPYSPPTPLLRAKLRVPGVGGHHIRRDRLFDLLDDVTAGPLTLVVAPAGAGKTALLAGWVAGSAVPAAWLSLDEADRDGVRFWTALIAAAETLAAGTGERALAHLRHGGDLREVAAELLTGLDGGPDHPPGLLVVDDVHLVDDDPTVASTLGFFVQHGPAWLHVVLISRRAPELPLGRLRAHGQLGEVRFAELRFQPDEAQQLLRLLAPGLSEDGIELVTQGADGWAASLQLAALAARSRQAQGIADPPRLADDALVEDYVLHDVFAAEAPDVLDALSELSVVDRVNRSLAAALTQRVHVGELLAGAEDRGLFLTRLAPEGWFGLHPLVRSVLAGVLAKRSPAKWREQHRRAALWYQEAGEVPLALEHLIVAGCDREALRLLAARHADLYDTGREPVILRAIAAIPAAVANADFEARVEYAWCHLLVDRRRYRQLVGDLTWWAEQSSVAPTLQARLTVLQSIAATLEGRWADGGSLARRAMGALGDAWWQDPLGRFGWNMVGREVALSEAWDDSHDDVREAEQALSRDPERRLALEGTRALGLALAGMPVDALRVAAGVRASAEVPSMSILRTELALAEAVAHREIGEQQRAVGELEQLAAAPAQAMLHCRVLAAVELVLAHLDGADLDAARATFQAVQALVDEESFGPDIRSSVARSGVLVALATGYPGDAARLASEVCDGFWAGVSAGRVHLAGGRRADALAALDGAEPRCARHEVVLALLRARAVDHHDEAAKLVTAAVELASAHGMLRTVAAEAGDVLDLVEQAAWRAPQPWIDRLRRAAMPLGLVGGDGRDGRAELTGREREVLRYLPSRLTLGEVAGEMYVSVNTLKFHLKSIYRKLGVTSRGEAAEVARRLASGGL